MSEATTGDFRIPPESLAQDAVRLLAGNASGAISQQSARAAERVRWLVGAQLKDDGSDALEQFDHDPGGPAAVDGLIEAIARCVRLDPDFADQLTVQINSDCLVDPASRSTVDQSRDLVEPALRWAHTTPLGPAVRLGFGILLLITGLWLRHHYTPIDDLCRTGLGALGRIADGTVAISCDTAELGARAGTWIILAGVVFGLEGGFRLARRLTAQAGLVSYPEVREQLDNLARSYLPGHVYNCAAGRRELCAELERAAAEAVARDGLIAVRWVRRYRSPVRDGLPPQYAQEYDDLVAATLGGI